MSMGGVDQIFPTCSI